MSCWRMGAVLAVGWVAWARIAVAGPDNLTRYVVSVGWNGTNHLALTPLKSADDDALILAATLSQTAKRTFLLTTFDEPTRRRYPPRILKNLGLDEPRAPTPAALSATLDHVHRLVQRDLRAGKRPVVVFSYSGHGAHVGDGPRQILLKPDDGARVGGWGYEALHRRLFAPVAALGHHLVLIVDACGAGQIVGKGKSERRPRTVASYERIGVILAQTGSAATHEHPGLGAGFFSYLVRSGITGPADLDGDRVVTFHELRAFVTERRRANDAQCAGRLACPGRDLKPRIAPPRDPNFPIVRRDDFKRRLEVPGVSTGGPVPGRLIVTGLGPHHLKGPGGGRWLSWHATPGRSVWVGIPPGIDTVLQAMPPVDGVIARAALCERGIPAASGVVEYDDLRCLPNLVPTKGAGVANDPFFSPMGRRHLAAALTDEMANPAPRLFRRPWHENTGAWALLASAIGGAAVGSALLFEGERLHGAAFEPRGVDDRRNLNERALRHHGAGLGLVVYGASALLASTLWLMLDRPWIVAPGRPPFTYSQKSGGAWRAFRQP